MRPNESSFVLDASAVLALLLQEPGWQFVADRADVAAVGAVNLSEVVARLVDGGVAAVAVQQSLSRLGMAVVPFDDRLAVQAGLLRDSTRRLGLSFGDRACIALAQHLQLPVLTADRAWSGLNVDVEVLVIR